MAKYENIKYSGTVGDIFAHRFVLIGETGNILADLGPKGAGKIQLRKGEKLAIEGEQKPSEVKVGKLIREGRETIFLERPKKPREEDADPYIALKTADTAGYETLGGPIRHAKHFELWARNKDGKEVELHIELNGAIRKEKLIERT
jgi:hypothetical protein